MSEQADAPEIRSSDAQKQEKKDSTHPGAENRKNGDRGLDFNVGEPKSIKPFLILVAASVIALVVMVVILFRMS